MTGSTYEERWYSGQDILDQFNVKGFELLKAVKSSALIPYEADTGKRVVDKDILPRKKKTLEEIEYSIKVENTRREMTSESILTSSGNIRGMSYRPLTDEEIKTQASAEYEAQNRPRSPFDDIDTLEVPPGSSAISFSLHLRKNHAVLPYIYRKDEVHIFLEHLNDKSKSSISGKSEPHQEPQPPISLEAKMKEARKKGGEASKKNKVILEAVKRFIRDNPKYIDKPNSFIADRFKRDIKKLQHVEVIVNSMTYEVSYEKEKINCFCNTNARDKYHDKSIAYTTFQERYVALAKEEVKKEKIDNQ